MEENKFYVTTTIPYANAAPHIGHALEFVQADVLARWNFLLGKEVFFLTGTDEHGTKNYMQAKKEGLDTQEFVDKTSDFFKELLSLLNCSNNNFIRTTDKKNHWPGVVDIWKKLESAGDIYKREYSGKYCSGCERFVTEKDLVDGRCPDHPTREIEDISDENYFFRLSKYSNEIIEKIKSGELKIYPERWKNDFLSLIKDGLTDVSFSRSRKQLPWGVPVPNDENQVMYVWCDALSNYLTGVGYPDERYKKYWPANLHVVGKDMLRFHAGIWPGMLLSAGIDLPKEIIVHGFLTIDGSKMSKSTGNVVDPIELSKKYGADSVRYYFCRNFVFGEDGDFSEKALVCRHNDELANKLGNLVSRVSGLCEKIGVEKGNGALKDFLDVEKVFNFIREYHFDRALNELFSFIDRCNEYVQNKKPWETLDGKILYDVLESIKRVSILLWPFIPDTSEKISKHLGFEISLDELSKPLGEIKISKCDVLFQKVEFVSNAFIGEESSQNLKNETKEKINKVKEVEEIMENVATADFSDWEKLDLRVAEVIDVLDIEGADKLYKLSINVGELGDRTICAGLKPYFSKEEIKGKKIIYFSNLAPRKMRGIESQGMLLAASNKERSNVVLIAPMGDIENGAIVG